MEKKQRPFTEKEDQIIILCLTEATSPNMSDVMRKASTLTGRSFQSCYQRWITMGKPTLESLKKQKEEFEDWKLIISFLYNEPIKTWITQYNYTNLFKTDWELLMDLVKKIEILEQKYKNHTVESEKNFMKVLTLFIGVSKEELYYHIVQFIKWYNKNEK